MPVTATSPTFWAKALTEKPLNTPASVVESMSACRPPVTSRRSSRLSTTSPMARMSAVVSVMITSITMNMEMIAPTAKVGAPNSNGVVSWNSAASPSREKLVAPNGIATRVPSTSPSRIATRLKNPGRNR
jgi:hypothetical protein